MKGNLLSTFLCLCAICESVSFTTSDSGTEVKGYEALLRKADKEFDEPFKFMDLSDFEGIFNTKIACEFHERLASLKDEIRAKLAISEKLQKLLKEHSKELKREQMDHVLHSGDSQNSRRSHVSEDFVQSDIIPTKSQADEIVDEINSVVSSRSRRQAFRDQNYPETVWRHGRVAFIFGNTTSEKVKAVFRMGAKLWRDNTCINIYEDTCGLSPDRIRVITEEGCSSNIGRVGGEQTLSLGEGCETVANAAHELGHALGFYHTQSRHDRWQYITVNFENIEPEHRYEFLSRTSTTNYNYNLPFDFGSIMLYDANAWSLSPILMPSMVPTDLNYAETMGSPFISFYDILMLNMHYNCTEKCKGESSAKCENCGFPHPRDCSKCICPSGYGGILCNERPSGCGSELVALTTVQTLKDTLGSKSDEKETRDEFQKCHYWIKAPAGKKIEVKLLSFSPQGLGEHGCKYDGVEIKTQADPRLTGYRFCSTQVVSPVLVSSSNIVPIITFNSFYESTTEIEYRYLD